MNSTPYYAIPIDSACESSNNNGEINSGSKKYSAKVVALCTAIACIAFFIFSVKGVTTSTVEMPRAANIVTETTSQSGIPLMYGDRIVLQSQLRTTSDLAFLKVKICYTTHTEN